MANDYSHFLHRHNFAAWVSARAAQRRWTNANTPRILKALGNSGLPGFLREPAKWPDKPVDFDVLHRGWCGRIVPDIESYADAEATFGRAAKVVAVYLKSMVVVGRDCDSALARIAHPPIDRIVLQGIAKDGRLDRTIRSLCRTCKWTELTEDSYYHLIAELRKRNMHQPAFWMLERYWSVAADTY